MKITKIAGYPIWHVHFPDQYTLAMTFIRMQECYESPSDHFRGKIFSLEEFMDWYVVEHGTFSYPKDWTGFNVPSSTVRMVWNHFRPHSEKEKELFSALIKNGVFTHERFYLIGTFGDDSQALEHEICHGIFFCDDEYRRAVTKVVMKFRLKKFRKYLLKNGYCREVLVDEIQAYAITGYANTKVSKKMRALRRELKKVVKEFFRK